MPACYIIIISINYTTKIRCSRKHIWCILLHTYRDNMRFRIKLTTVRSYPTLLILFFYKEFLSSIFILQTNFICYRKLLCGSPVFAANIRINLWHFCKSLVNRLFASTKLVFQFICAHIYWLYKGVEDCFLWSFQLPTFS